MQPLGHYLENLHLAISRNERCFILVLSRKLGEAVLIGEPGPNQIRVVVVDIDRGKIRLGFEAARNIPIMRQELLPLVPSVLPTPVD